MYYLSLMQCESANYTKHTAAFIFLPTISTYAIVEGKIQIPFLSDIHQQHV